MVGDRLFREIGDHVWDPTRRIEEMDGQGVSMQVLSTVPVMFSYWAKPTDALDLSRRLNDHVAQVVRDHPTRFTGLGGQCHLLSVSAQNGATALYHCFVGRKVNGSWHVLLKLWLV